MAMTIMLLFIAYTKDKKCIIVCPDKNFCQVDTRNKKKPLACSNGQYVDKYLEEL